MGPNRNAAVARLDKLDKSNRLSGGAMNRPKPNTIIRQPRLEVRNHRYLNLFDAMKKSAKNREKSKSQGMNLQDYMLMIQIRRLLRRLRIISQRSRLSMLLLLWISLVSKQNEIVPITRLLWRSVKLKYRYYPT
jgi:hypothetical protein